MTIERRSLVFLAILWTFLCVVVTAATAQIQVTATSPSAAPQGTINLNVTVSGNGFKRGANAQWFLSGTTNPGGVTVNSTTFKSSSQLTANITVASDAQIAGFDVVVKNSDGRTGKGTDLFAVTTKGTPIGCTTSGTPSGFSLVGVLNPVQPNGAALITSLRLGNAIRVRRLDLDKNGTVDSLVAFITSGQTGSEVTYVFLLDPATGLPQTTNPVTGAAWQNPIPLLTGFWSTGAAAGDVNGDGVPDFAMLNNYYLFVGSVSGPNSPSPYTLSYTAYPMQPPAGAGFGSAVAMGDLDGDGADEIAIATASTAKRNAPPPSVSIYKYSAGSLSYVNSIPAPTGATLFGSSIAIGNIDGNAGNELAVGAKSATTPNGGAVYVYPAPLQQSSYFVLTGPGPQFGEGLGIADVNLDGFPDLVVNTGAQFSGSDTSAQTLVFAGNVHGGASYTNSLLPASGLSNSWGAPNYDVGNLQSVGAVAIGAPNATNSGVNCSIKGGVGTVHLFTSPFSSSQQPNYVFQPPSLIGSSQFEFGYGVGIATGYPFLLVGAHFQDVGTTLSAGQVYVYKKN